MNLSDDDKVALGQYCENLMNDRFFNDLVQCYDISTTHMLLNTAPNEQPLREHYYHEIQGVRGLLDLMANFVKTKNELLNPAPFAADEDAADAQEID